jgi:hypothetical protein
LIKKVIRISTGQSRSTVKLEQIVGRLMSTTGAAILGAGLLQIIVKAHWGLYFIIFAIPTSFCMIAVGMNMNNPRVWGDTDSMGGALIKVGIISILFHAFISFPLWFMLGLDTSSDTSPIIFDMFILLPLSGTVIMILSGWWFKRYSRTMLFVILFGTGFIITWASAVAMVEMQGAWAVFSGLMAALGASIFIGTVALFIKDRLRAGY